MSRKWKGRILVILIIAAIILVLRFTYFKSKPVEITVYEVRSGIVEETVTNSKAGTVKVRHRANLSPEIGGRVVFLKAREGEFVQKDDVLLRLDDQEMRASVNLSERAAQAAAAARKEACITSQTTRRTLERNRSLHEQGVISAAVLDQYQSQFETSVARCDASKAEEKRAVASADVARANLNKTIVKAPFSGVIVQLSTEVGEWVTPSPPGVPIPPVIDLLDNNSVYIEAPMDETDAARLKMSQPVRISLDPYPDQSFPGTLTRVAPFVRDIEGQNRTVDVEAELADKEFSRTLLPGTSADVEVILRAKSNVLRIPTYSLLEGNRVLAVENDVLVSKNVKTGLKNWEFIEIVSGLNAGERIAASVEKAEMKEGAKVPVVQEPPK